MISAGAGSDTIVGGAGDTIDGGAGYDTLILNGNEDEFVFVNNGGTGTIRLIGSSDEAKTFANIEEFQFNTQEHSTLPTYENPYYPSFGGFIDEQPFAGPDVLGNSDFDIFDLPLLAPECSPVMAHDYSFD